MGMFKDGELMLGGSLEKKMKTAYYISYYEEIFAKIHREAENYIPSEDDFEEDE